MAWILAHPKLCGLLLLLALAAGSGGYLAYRWGEAKVVKAEAAQKAAEDAQRAAEDAVDKAEAAAELAQAARSRNDAEIPRVRAATAAAVSAAAGASAADSVRLGQAAQDGYSAAADKL